MASPTKAQVLAVLLLLAGATRGAFRAPFCPADTASSVYCNFQPCKFNQCVCGLGYTGSSCETVLSPSPSPSPSPVSQSASASPSVASSPSPAGPSVASSPSPAGPSVASSPSPAGPSAASSPSPAASASPSPESTAPPSSSGSNLYYLGFLALLAAIPIAIGVAVWYFWESIVARWYPTPEPVFYPTRPVATDLQPRVVAYLQPSVAYYPPPPPPTPMAP